MSVSEYIQTEAVVVIRAVLDKLVRRKGLLLGAAALATIAAASSTLARRRKFDRLAQDRHQRREEERARLEKHFAGPISPSQKIIVTLPLAELRQKLRDGELNCLAVLEAFTAAALAADRATNCVTEFLWDEAWKLAKKLDELPKEQRGPLHGVPVSFKELVAFKGHDCTVGIVANLTRPPPTENAGLVDFVQSLGAVPFCRTNLAQTCISFDSSNPIFGATIHPKDPTRSPGGSSGGEGALVAAGGSIMGFGTDLGGSVRIPASFCGVSSLKPTAGRLPQTGQGSDGGLVGVVGMYNTLGAIGRTAADIEDFMSATLGADEACKPKSDPRFVPLPWRSGIAKKNSPLKIGWYDDDGTFKATPGSRRAVQVALSHLRSSPLNHQFVQMTPENLPEIVSLYVQLKGADGGMSTLNLLAGSQVDEQSIGFTYRCTMSMSVITKLYSAYIAKVMSAPLSLKRAVAPILSWWSPILASGLTSEKEILSSKNLWRFNARALELTEAVLRQMDSVGVDVILAPGCSTPAQPLGFPGYLGCCSSYTRVYNLLNFAVGTVPVTEVTTADQDSLASYPGYETDLTYGWVKEALTGAEGLPLSVQVIGRPWTEELVLRAMREIEEIVVEDEDRKYQHQ